MRQVCWTVAVLTLLALPVMYSAAQDAKPVENGRQEQPATLPPLPAAPFVKEDAEAIQAHLDALRLQLEAARTDLADKRTAADQPDLTPEDKLARDEAVRLAQEAVKAVEAQQATLNEALTAAKDGPTRAQLEARRRYDELAALAQQVRKELTPGQEKTETSEGVPEGDLARVIRLAEEEQVRADQLAAAAREFEFQKSRVYEKLSDIEKLDYELRWANERFQLSVAAYDHLVNQLFRAYEAYEARAFEGLQAIEQALKLWAGFSGTPAEKLGLPEPAVDPAVLDDPRSAQDTRGAIEVLYDGRVSKNRTGQKLRLREFAGSLKRLQQEIDTREDYKERLEQDAERLKNSLAESGAKPAAAPEPDAKPESELEEYQRLSRQIDEYQQVLKDNAAELARLAKEREELARLVGAKQQVELEVTGLADQTRARIDAIEAQFAKPSAKPEGEQPPKPKVEVPAYYRRPVAALFGLRERLEAEEERLSSAKRDTRQVQTQLEILDRRVERINSRSAEIESELLPGTRSRYYEEIGKTVGVRAAKVIGVLLAAWLILFLIRKIGEPLIERIVSRADKKSEFSADEQQRARTLMTVFMTTARVVVYITAIMFAIAQFDVDYGPLLVAAGGVSLAVGFGAQTLVKDFFAGFFILLEGQFSIGDVIEVNGKTGTVENLNLRTTVIRSLNGDVHTIPNGEISVTTNQTKLWSRAIVDIGVAYEENTDDVSAVMEGVAKEMREDEAWGKKVLDAILMGVVELGDSAVTIRMLLKTRAGEQWGASREYMRRCKLKFDELGIEIPWPQTVLSYKHYADKDEKTLAADERKKRAQLLRYVRRMRGEMSEEEIALAGMSVEERDRAETLAKREVELARDKGEDKKEPPADTAEQTAKAEEQLSDAEKLAKQLASKQIEEQARPAESPQDPPGKQQ
ncbi:MAG: mechanosensitive ion channel [Planctomycetes bacterium]|nr:mechanosensitive ion channel [Planctomycetota bacterium]MCB9935605.1 mechanosensitive ion channel [Planctomycetota bacterium]